jgi:hypothetical protein
MTSRLSALDSGLSGARASFGVRVCDESGVALVVAMMSVLLMTALGVALMMMTMTEGRIASNYREGTEALYAADAAIERVMQDLLTVPDWDTILAGTTTSAFIDGPASGNRTLPDGSTLDLTVATNMVRCGKTVCADSDITTATDERPWGANNPKWQLYAYGPMTDMIPTATINSSNYVVVWVGDDPAESDGDPLHDGTTDTNLGRGVLTLLAHAYGPDGVRRVIEVTVARTDTTEIERGYTGQRGQDEQNRRARKAAIQTPGKALTRSDMTIASGGLVKQ